jgi:hypothetical protein
VKFTPLAVMFRVAMLCGMVGLLVSADDPRYTAPPRKRRARGIYDRRVKFFRRRDADARAAITGA